MIWRDDRLLNPAPKRRQVAPRSVEPSSPASLVAATTRRVGGIDGEPVDVLRVERAQRVRRHVAPHGAVAARHQHAVGAGGSIDVAALLHDERQHQAAAERRLRERDTEVGAVGDAATGRARVQHATTSGIVGQRRHAAVARGAHLVECRAAVVAAEHPVAVGAGVDRVAIARIDGDRPDDRPDRHRPPRGAAVGALEGAATAGAGVEHVWMLAVDLHGPHGGGRETLIGPLPGRAAVHGLEHSCSTVDAGIQNVRPRRIDGQPQRGAGSFPERLPAPAAVRGLEQAAAERRRIDDLAVHRVDHHRAHGEIGEAGVGRLERAAFVTTAPHTAAKRCDVDEARIAGTHAHRRFDGRRSDRQRLPGVRLCTSWQGEALEQHHEGGDDGG